MASREYPVMSLKRGRDGLPSASSVAESSYFHHKLNVAVIARRQAKVYYGIPKDPDLVPLAQALETDSDEEQNEKERGHRRKMRREFFIRKSKGDINAPPPNRMPFPAPTERDRLLKLDQMRDMLKAAQLRNGQLPSAVCVTLYGESDQLTCAEFSDDCELLCAGYQDSRIRVWPTTTNQILYKLRPAAELPENTDAENAFDAAFDKTSGTDCQILSCHGACPVSCKFSPCRRLLLAGCDDGVLRMFNLLTFELTCQYRGHTAAIWSVDFNPAGFYFASAGHDRSTRVWSTEAVSPLRIFVEADGEDISCVRFHPNGQYLATGSWSPAIVRLYDCSAPSNGGQQQAVRQFYGHHSPVKVIAFSRCGRYIVSADEDSCIFVWDIQEPGRAAVHLCPRKNAQPTFDAVYGGISRIEFSHDNSLFIAADLNSMLHIWDARGLFEYFNNNNNNAGENKTADGALSPAGSGRQSVDDLREPSRPRLTGVTAGTSRWARQFLIRTIHTKKTPVFTAKFTRRNILWVSGPYVVDYPGETAQSLNKPAMLPAAPLPSTQQQQQQRHVAHNALPVVQQSRKVD